jgi:hypothetical protein
VALIFFIALAMVALYAALIVSTVNRFRRLNEFIRKSHP